MSAPAIKFPRQKTFFDSAVRFGLPGVVPFGLGWAYLMSLFMGWSFRSLLPTGVAIGLAFGVCFGITMAGKFKDIVIRIDIVDALNFPSQLMSAMAAAGYKLAAQDDDSFIYKPMLRSGLLMGDVWGEWNQDEAAIVGPSMHVKKVRDRLVREQKRSLRN
jgi:hypothetical protein